VKCGVIALCCLLAFLCKFNATPDLDLAQIKGQENKAARTWLAKSPLKVVTMNRMTLDQLRVFVAVAERQHLTKAAEALNLAQSAVSTAISTLENRHNTKLFHRVGRGIELAEAGILFAKEARAILARVASAELMLAELAGLKQGTLIVQASQTIASYWLPRHLATFRQAYPGIDIRLRVSNSKQTAEAVLNGTAELGFVEGPVEDPLLTSAPIAAIKWSLSLPPSTHGPTTRPSIQ
jgi:DNA-binding transcriptional LysR family regulator